MDHGKKPKTVAHEDGKCPVQDMYSYPGFSIGPHPLPDSASRCAFPCVELRLSGWRWR